MNDVEQIKNNLRIAIDLIKSISEHRIDLESFSSSCGTFACTLGHVAMHPHFNDLGIVSFLGSNATVSVDGNKFDAFGHNYYWNDGLNRVFGEDAFDIIFTTRRNNDPDECSDKEIAIQRLQRQLNIYENVDNG